METTIWGLGCRTHGSGFGTWGLLGIKQPGPREDTTLAVASLVAPGDLPGPTEC